MRVLSVALLCALALPGLAPVAQAAVGWTEANENGRIVTRWTRGADLNEVHAAVRAASGPYYSVLAICRQPGYFAFVGSDIETERGVSCGFEDQAAAVYAARLRCENEGGRCDTERVGFDDASSLVGNISKLPTELPGSTLSGGNVSPLLGPVAIQ